MTDKEKIRKEVERLRNLHQMKYQQLDLDADSGLSLVECGKRNLCNELLSFIDSLQEEPLSRTPADIESAMQEVEEKSRAYTEAHQGENADTILAQMRGEKPVSEDLGKVGSLKSLEYYPEKKTTNKTSKGVFDANMPRRKAYLRGFKDGAHAHKELIANKPVSNDLEAAARKAATWHSRERGDMFFPNDYHKFIAGAKWQKEQLIGKACEWLKSYRQDTPDGTGYIAGIVNDKTIEDFRRAMEE